MGKDSRSRDGCSGVAHETADLSHRGTDDGQVYLRGMDRTGVV